MALELTEIKTVQLTTLKSARLVKVPRRTSEVSNFLNVLKAFLAIADISRKRRELSRPTLSNEDGSNFHSGF